MDDILTRTPGKPPVSRRGAVAMVWMSESSASSLLGLKQTMLPQASPLHIGLGCLESWSRGLRTA